MENKIIELEDLEMVHLSIFHRLLYFKIKNGSFINLNMLELKNVRLLKSSEYMQLVIRFPYSHDRGVNTTRFSNPPLVEHHAYRKEHMFFNIEDLIKCKGKQVGFCWPVVRIAVLATHGILVCTTKWPR